MRQPRLSVFCCCIVCFNGGPVSSRPGDGSSAEIRQPACTLHILVTLQWPVLQSLSQALVTCTHLSHDKSRPNALTQPCHTQRAALTRRHGC